MVMVAPDHVESFTGRLTRKVTAADQNAISGKYFYESGTIIYSKIRPYLVKAVLVDFRGLCSADMYPLTPLPNISAGYVIAHLLGDRFTKFVESASARSGIPKVNRQDLAEFKIPVPPLPEQQAIAEALSDMDDLIAAQAALIEKKQAIKQGAMQELLTGRRRLPGFEGEWKEKRIGDVAQITSGGTPNTSNEGYWGGDIPWMSSGELNKKIVNEVDGRITQSGLENSSATIIPPNCVLVGLAGQGKTRGTVAINTISLSTNQSIAAIWPSEEYISTYLYYNLDHRYEELRNASTGDGGRGGLNLNILSKFSVYLPEKPEQDAISSILLDIDAELHLLRKEILKMQSVKQGMMQELLSGRIRLI